MSITTSKTQPALIGGLFIGVLSALPLIYAGNCCCCMWIIGGGMLAAYMLQQNSPEPITQGDAALTGLMAGLVGAGVYGVLLVPITILVEPLERQFLQRLFENAQNMPPAWREIADRSAAANPLVKIIVSFCMFLVVGSIFSTIGGLLGAVFFRKTPPATNTNTTTSSL